ncbi:MAG: glycoside-pentoside-hexuronide (GPH):cation symporter [Propionibacteriaceae bacterium]|nr:glycoside-pentoside-hexuronide (GPH):cation symporter [Propionibacteriaceae bacterium]
MTSSNLRRNKWTFAVGTIGRDMTYTLISMYFIYYLSNIVKPSTGVFALVSSLILGARLFDVVMDIVMGSVVDNTRSRWGHYKPWILGGMILSGLFTILLFTPMSLGAAGFVIVFFLLYLAWSLSWTMNDIPYWSLMPTLSLDQKERERFGSLAKIFATIGQFAVVGTIIPVTGLFTNLVGARNAWLVYTVIIIVIMIAGQSVTLIGVKAPDLVVEQERVRVRDIFSVVVKNDQLLWVAIAMILFMTGYVTTTSFGTYFFQYAYKDLSMYTPFGLILGVASVGGYLVFPVLRRRFNRKTLYTLATGLIVAGYVVFYFAPLNSTSPARFIVIAIAGLLLFVGDTFVTILMLMFIADTIDYGHWKLGRRNTAITFALQPFINKVGAALSAEIVALTIIWAGIKQAGDDVDLVTDAGLTKMKMIMLVLPLILTLIGYLLYRWKYTIDETFHAQILSDLRGRGQLTEEADEAVAAEMGAQPGDHPKET